MQAFSILLALLLLSCQSPANKQPPKLYGVIFRVQVSPAGLVEAFNVNSTVDPFGSGVLLVIDPDWLMAACMVFKAQMEAGPKPTYKDGDPPAAAFIQYLYDKDRPQAFFGKDPENPVYFVPEGLASGPRSNDEESDVCDREIGRPAA